MAPLFSVVLLGLVLTFTRTAAAESDTISTPSAASPAPAPPRSSIEVVEDVPQLLDFDSLAEGAGAEDFDLWLVREKNIAVFNGLFSALSVCPHVALGMLRLLGGNATDEIIFGRDEAAAKSPWSDPWATVWFIVWPTSILREYLLAFDDTNPLATFGLMSTFFLADASVYVDVASMAAQPALRWTLLKTSALRVLTSLAVGAFYYGLSALLHLCQLDVLFYLALVPAIVVVACVERFVPPGWRNYGRVCGYEWLHYGRVCLYVPAAAIGLQLFFSYTPDARAAVARPVSNAVFALWIALQVAFSIRVSKSPAEKEGGCSSELAAAASRACVHSSSASDPS